MLVHQAANSVGNYNYNAVIYDNCEWYYHFHKNYELIFMLSGDIIAAVDNHTESLHVGDFALILPNQIHSFHTPEASKVWIGVFSEDYIFAFSSQTNKKAGRQAKFTCDPFICSYLVHTLIEEDTRDIFLLKSCFYAVCSQYKKNANFIEKQSDNDDLICKIADYVSGSFKNNLSLRIMAHDLGFEYHYLSRRFHSIFNMNFCQFVNQYRMNCAQELLSQNYGSIENIAYESGFQSVRSFNNNYRNFFGSVPSKHK